MTGPAVDNPSNAVTIEEMEQELAAQTPKGTPKDFVFEGDQVPEAIRGKSAAEILERQERLEQALRISETARLAIENRAASTPAPAAPAAPVDDYKPLTREQIQQAYDEDPLKAFEMMQNDALIRADKHFERRFGQLENATSQSMESWARQQYPDEFEVLGSDIQQLVAQIPNKAVFNTKEGWRDAIDYVRGKNFEKMYEFKSNGKRPKTADTARREQAADTGFSPRPSVRPTAPAEVDTDLDATTQHIADVMGLTPEEYKKWAKVGTTR